MLTRILRTKIANTIITVAFAAAGVVDLAGGAAADDAIVTKAPAIPFTGPTYNWNGFYAGGHFGVAWGNSNWTAGPGISGSNNLFQPINSWDEAGSFFAGLQGGYNYVLPSRILLGAEVDATFPAFQPLPVGVNPFGLTIGGTSNFTSPTLGAVSFAETVLSSGTVRGRIGYAPGHLAVLRYWRIRLDLQSTVARRKSPPATAPLHFCGGWDGRRAPASKSRSRRTGRRRSNICLRTTAGAPQHSSERSRLRRISC